MRGMHTHEITRRVAWARIGRVFVGGGGTTREEHSLPEVGWEAGLGEMGESSGYGAVSGKQTCLNWVLKDPRDF